MLWTPFTSWTWRKSLNMLGNGWQCLLASIMWVSSTSETKSHYFHVSGTRLHVLQQCGCDIGDGGRSCTFSIFSMLNLGSSGLDSIPGQRNFISSSEARELCTTSIRIQWSEKIGRDFLSQPTQLSCVHVLFTGLRCICIWNYNSISWWTSVSLCIQWRRG